MSCSPRPSSFVVVVILTAAVLTAGCNRSSNKTPPPGQPAPSGQPGQPAPPAPAPPAPVVEQVHECDTYAAHPDDAARWATGVGDEAIVPGVALDRCTKAASHWPQTPRFQFQLGRVLLVMRRSADAMTAFTKAADNGYCPAKYYLAEMAIEEWNNGADDGLDEARRLYEEAEQCHFAPATRRLRDLRFSSDGFDAPKVIKALVDKDIATLNSARLPVALYLQGFNEYMSMEFHPVSQECPALVARASVLYDLDAAAAGDSRLGAFSLNFLTSAVGVTPAPVRALIDPVYTADPEKFKGYFRGLGKRDAIQLIERLGGTDGGCTSPVTAQIYGQVIEFAKVKRPIQEYWREVLANTVQLFGGLGVKSATPPPQEPTP
jgi:hypothetical protein